MSQININGRVVQITRKTNFRKLARDLSPQAERAYIQFSSELRKKVPRGVRYGEEALRKVVGEVSLYDLTKQEIKMGIEKRFSGFANARRNYKIAYSTENGKLLTIEDEYGRKHRVSNEDLIQDSIKDALVEKYQVDNYNQIKWKATVEDIINLYHEGKITYLEYELFIKTYKEAMERENGRGSDGSL